jgi:uncharacterized membrane protein YjgN (DUF898 family)
MSSSSKIFLGVLTLLPFVLIIIYFVAFLSSFMNIIQASHQGNQQAPFPEDFFKHFIGLIVLVMVAGLLSLGLLIYYIIHAINNNAIDSNERLVWILIFVFAGMIGFPVYWFMRIWQTKPVNVSSPDQYQ